jgi:hypothetical protein
VPDSETVRAPERFQYGGEQEYVMYISSLLRVTAVSLALAAPLCPYSVMAANSAATGEATAARGTAMQVPIKEVSNPKGRLANASVQDKNGANIGTVHKVIVDDQGKPIAVQVDVGGFLGIGTKRVEIKAMDLKYEQDRNVLTTTLRKPAIESLPAVKA